SELGSGLTVSEHHVDREQVAPGTKVGSTCPTSAGDGGWDASGMVRALWINFEGRLPTAAFLLLLQALGRIASERAHNHGARWDHRIIVFQDRAPLGGRP